MPRPIHRDAEDEVKFVARVHGWTSDAGPWREWFTRGERRITVQYQRSNTAGRRHVRRAWIDGVEVQPPAVVLEVLAALRGEDTG